jgi:hypothetical protein
MPEHQLGIDLVLRTAQRGEVNLHLKVRAPGSPRRTGVAVVM